MSRSLDALQKEFERGITADLPELLQKTSAHLNERSREFSVPQLVGLSAFLHLPDDPEERIALVNAYEQKPETFTDAAAKAMYEYLRCGPEIRLAYGCDWRSCVDPDLAASLPLAMLKKLDSAAARVALPRGEDHTRINSWLEVAIGHGLLTDEDQKQLGGHAASKSEPKKTDPETPAKKEQKPASPQENLLNRLELLGGK